MAQFIAENPNFVLCVVSMLLSMLGYVFKRSLDNNTDALNKISDSIISIENRVHQNELEIVAAQHDITKQRDLCVQQTKLCPIYRANA